MLWLFNNFIHEKLTEGTLNWNMALLVNCRCARDMFSHSGALLNRRCGIPHIPSPTGRILQSYWFHWLNVLTFSGIFGTAVVPCCSQLSSLFLLPVSKSEKTVPLQRRPWRILEHLVVIRFICLKVQFIHYSRDTALSPIYSYKHHEIVKLCCRIYCTYSYIISLHQTSL